MTASRSLPQRALARAARGWRVIRRSLTVIAGAPDYDRYLDHLHRAHPGCPPLSRDEFCRGQLEARYNRVGSRCC